MHTIEERLEKAELALLNAGFRECDIPACNCGSWHHVGGFKLRFDEIKEVVEDAGFSTNGRTLLDAVKEMARAAVPDVLTALKHVRIQFKETLGEDRPSRILRDVIDRAISKADGI